MRTCEYFPIGLSNGQNDAIFLEEDYMAYDLEKTKEEILALETKQKEALAQLETSYKKEKDLRDSLILGGTNNTPIFYYF